jgi:serine/threonine-protein kinase
VKRIDLASLNISTPVGTDEGYSGDGGPADLARLDLPSSVLFGFDDNTLAIFPDKMYISDQANQRIRMVDSAMNITTYAGSGIKGYLDGPWDEAQFSFPDGANPIPGGRIAWGHHPYGLIVADTENNRIRYISEESKDVFTIAGSGNPGYSGDNDRARWADLNYPTDVLVTIDHEIFIADTYNHVIRKIDAVGYIHTVVGTGTPGVSPDGTPATEAMLNTPSGIGWDEASRTLYIADTYNHQVKKVKLPR